jgi:hypothetical protein
MEVHYLPIAAMEVAEKYYYHYLARNKEISDTPLYKFENGDKAAIKNEDADCIAMAIDLVKPSQTFKGDLL